MLEDRNTRESGRQKIGDQPRTLFGEETLWVKLHAFDGHRLVTNPHQFIAIGPRRDLEVRRERIALKRQRMVSRRDERIRQAVVDAMAVVMDGTRLTVHEPFRTDDAPAKRLPDALMTKANAEDWNPTAQLFDNVNADPGFVGRAWPRRDDDVRRVQRGDLVHRNLIVANNLHLARVVQRTNRLHEVVRKRVVVIDNQDHARKRNKVASIQQLGCEPSQHVWQRKKSKDSEKSTGE